MFCLDFIPCKRDLKQVWEWDLKGFGKDQNLALKKGKIPLKGRQLPRLI